MNKETVTLVTGMWDIGRENLTSFKRNFDHYLECFEKLINLDFHFYIFIPDELIPFVVERRNAENTFIHVTPLSLIKKNFKYFDMVQELRTDPAWYNINTWLPESTQASLEYYNPIVMSKPYLLRQAAINNPFDSKYLFWIDGGLANSVCPEYIENLKYIPDYMESIKDKFLMLSFDYESDIEVHGFKASAFSRYCGVDKSNYVCRGGFFGGTPIYIDQVTDWYDKLLHNTLHCGYMGTEENILTILAHQYPELIHKYELPDSLVYSFFLALK